MEIITPILLGLFASIAFYFIELKVFRKVFIAKIKGTQKLDNLTRNDETVYYLSFHNESKVDAFNVSVYVEFLNDKGIATGYNEKRVFPYVVKKHQKEQEILYPLFSNIPREKRKEKIKEVIEGSKNMHVVITCQNQYGKIKKTDDFVTSIQEDRRNQLFGY